MSNLFINPQTREMLDPGEVTVRRIGDRQFYVESSTGAIVLPSSTPRPATSDDPLTLSGTTGAQLPEPAPGRQHPGDTGRSGERSQASALLYGLLFTAFYHPLKRYGIILLILGAGVFTAMDRGPWYARIIAAVYGLAYVVQVIRPVRNAREDPPGFPGIIRSTVLAGFTLVITFIPLMLYTLAWLGFNLHKPTALYLVIGMCMFYLPMGIMAASVRGSFSGIHPAKVMRGIFVAGPGYLLPVLLGCAFFITRYYAIDLAEATGNTANSLYLINLLSFYLIATQAYMLRFLSHRLEKRLGWTNHGIPT